MLWSDKPSGEMFPKEEIQWKKLLHWMDFLKSFFTPFIKAKIIYDWMSCIILCTVVFDCGILCLRGRMHEWQERMDLMGKTHLYITFVVFSVHIWNAQRKS